MHKDSQEISQVLGGQYAMFYNPAVQINLLHPIQTLEKCIDIVNSQLKILGKNLSNWPVGFQNEIAKLVRVNWIYQRLSVEPIRKPLLAHCDRGQLKLDCGDTRVMALKLLENPPNLGVIITCPLTDIGRYSNWQRIYTSQELIDCIGLDPDLAQVFFTPTAPGATHALAWLEIGDPSTSHHLHDIDLRIQMMQNYLDSQTQEIEFTVDWARSQIKWQ